MLPDEKINSLDTHLEQFKLNHKQTQNNLDNILKEYSQLLEDYKILKRTLHDQGTSIIDKRHPDRASQPYVLVLVDGNGYIFNDELVREKEEGGMRAARMLNDVVEKYINQSLPEARNARVIVRIYADLTTLSKQLAKSKLTGLEKRSLAPFTAGFTRAINLFDFVDCLDEEGTKFKIREQFKFASDDPTCSHILYAACHDTAYLSQLVPFGGVRNKITLVQGASWNSEFHQFSLNVTQFPTVFRWSELPSNPASAKSSTVNGGLTPKAKLPHKQSSVPTPNSAASRTDGPWRSNSAGSANRNLGVDTISVAESNGFADNDGWGVPTKLVSPTKSLQTPCKYFQKGFCRFGTKCDFLHSRPGPGPGPNPGPQSNGTTMDRSNVTSSLPTSTVSGFIPLNKDNQRLDASIRPPTQEEWAVYNKRFRKQKPCNSFHLKGVCTTYGCPYDHDDLEPEARHTLVYVLKCNPCPAKTQCRASDCFYGHLCQKDECFGQMKGCRMKADLHNIDPKLASMVPAEDDLEDDNQSEDSDNNVW